MSEDDGSFSGSSIIEEDPDPEDVGKDRLSDLPDTLLITILSLLPVHSAAATSILSRRWRDLWTLITRVYIRFPYSRHDRFEANVATVENKIMAELRSPIIRTFNLELSPDLSYFNVSSHFLVSWLQQICGRNPVNVQVNLGGISTLFRRSCQIPICVFQCQSLVKLYLHGSLYFGFFDDDPNIFTLPNLKKLALDLSDDQDIASIGLLFAACPLLEGLNLTLSFEKDYLPFFNDQIIVVDLSIPNLKILRLHVKATYGKGCKIDINSPNLETCHIKGHLAFYDFVAIPENLQAVVISIKKTSFGDDSDYITKISGLIQGIYYVSNLTLEKSAFHLLDSISHLDAPLPIFHNLVDLTLNIDDWIGKLPGSFFLGNLKRVVIRDVKCEVVEIHLVQHILTEATTLEELYVVIDCPYNDVEEDQHQKEHDFCRKLFMLPKSSENCEICFSGTAGAASSEEYFKDGEITFYAIDDLDPLSDSDDTVETGFTKTANYRLMA